MFEHEARVIAALRHPNIARVFEAGVAEDGSHYLAMEYVDGVTLRELLDTAHHAGRTLPLDFALTVVAAAASGLHHAHERSGPDGPLGIVHRDVSPSNIMIGRDGAVKVIDFGIAWSRVRTAHTAAGHIKGKPGYMAPEQLRGEPVDRRTDVFALGIVAYEATTQARAFRASTAMETARRIVHGELVAPATVRPGYPPALAEVVRIALATRSDERFATADALRRAVMRVAGELGLGLGPPALARVVGAMFPDARAAAPVRVVPAAAVRPVAARPRTPIAVAGAAIAAATDAEIDAALEGVIDPASSARLAVRRGRALARGTGDHGEEEDARTSRFVSIEPDEPGRGDPAGAGDHDDLDDGEPSPQVTLRMLPAWCPVPPIVPAAVPRPGAPVTTAPHGAGPVAAAAAPAPARTSRRPTPTPSPSGPSPRVRAPFPLGVAIAAYALGVLTLLALYRLG